MKPPTLCDLEEIPKGKTIGDINPAFSGLKGELRVGKMNSHCAACRKPFNEIRKPRREIKLYPAALPVPVGWSYHICGRCLALYQRDAQSRQSVLAAIESFHLGENPTQ